MTAAVTKRSNGKMEFARRETDAPAWWEGLAEMGEAGKLKEGATVDEWVKAAGMEWTAERVAIQYNVGGSKPDLREDKDTHVLYRSDTKDQLGVVSARYQIVQPGEALEFFRDLVDAAGYKLITAGTLHGGRKVWAQADIGADAEILKGDRVQGRLLFATALDGSMHSIARTCGERVVCANTLAIAMGEAAKREVRVSHRSKFDPAAVKQQLGVAVPAFARFIAQAREMAKFKLAPKDVARLTFATMGRDDTVLKGRGFDPKSEADKRVIESVGYKRVIELFNGEALGHKLPGVQGTLWGWVNAVSEYTDHHVRARSDAHRVDSAMFGYGDDTKALAWDAAAVLVK